MQPLKHIPAFAHISSEQTSFFAIRKNTRSGTKARQSRTSPAPRGLPRARGCLRAPKSFPHPPTGLGWQSGGQDAGHTPQGGPRRHHGSLTRRIGCGRPGRPSPAGQTRAARTSAARLRARSRGGGSALSGLKVASTAGPRAPGPSPGRSPRPLSRFGRRPLSCG